MTFSDVAGVEEAKDEVEESSPSSKTPKVHLPGGRIPKGVLMMGPPGTGKTLFARAIAGESGRAVLQHFGQRFRRNVRGRRCQPGARPVRAGQASRPRIIFIDEIDAVGRHRGAGLGGGHDEREQTLNQLLVEMDGFESNDGVIAIAATNRPDVLDPALLRPGRFDRRIVGAASRRKRPRRHSSRVHAAGAAGPDVDLGGGFARNAGHFGPTWNRWSRRRR